MNDQRSAALERLAATGIWRSNYAPPLLHILWGLGLNVPPPHFAPFWANALVTGGFFAVVWASLMWFSVWSAENMPLSTAMKLGAGAGVAFGLTLAIYYEFGKRKHRLPSWSSLGTAAK